MGKTPGTTLAEPVAKDQQPDLRSSLHEITEYLDNQGAYDLFDYLLKELLTKQPSDPIDHLLKCLQTEHSAGPLKVIVSSAPGVGREDLSNRIASSFGLEIVKAGDLLRNAGVDVINIGYADECEVAELVMERIAQAEKEMKGWVLDGFPRTRQQTSFLKERSVVPTHVLVLKADEEAILKRNQAINDGYIQGEAVSVKALKQKLDLYTCHATSALEAYKERIRSIDCLCGDDSHDETQWAEVVWAQTEKVLRTLPRSKGPQNPARVVILGPRGVGVREHTALLASRLGAVFVDATQLGPKEMALKMPSLMPLIETDRLGAVGVRLRQPDCVKQGWVLCGFPLKPQQAKLLMEDADLAPTRVAVLTASVETCVQRLRLRMTDSATGKVWTTRPRSDAVRKRLQRNPNDQPTAVEGQYAEYSKNLEGILPVVSASGSCAQIPADDPLESVYSEVVEFVERPLPLAAPKGQD